MSYVILHAITLLVYLIAAVVYGAELALKVPTHHRRGRLFLLLGIAVHTAAIGAFCLQTRQSPFAGSFGTLSIMAWVIALLYLPVELLARVPALGATAMPVCCLMLFAAFTRTGARIATAPQLRTAFTNVHVLFILTSFALFVLAACCAICYVWQYRLLKHHDRAGRFRYLPPLETVDSIAYHLVAFALPLLTLGLAFGVLQEANGSLTGRWLTDPRILVSLAAWGVYAAYLIARTVAGWRGTRINYLLIVGMVITIAIYFTPTTSHRFA